MKFRKIIRKHYAIFAACTIVMLAGCGSDPAAPGVEPEIINGTQSFEFQVSSVKDFSGSWSYTWNNASPTASVDHSSALSGGSATLTIRDAAGATVYNRSLGDDGSFETSAGVAGDWVLTISLDGASGDLNFRADEGS